MMTRLSLSSPLYPLASLAALGLLLAAAPRPEAAPVPAAAAAKPAVVSHVKIVSEHVEDVSSIEAWRKAFIKPGMTDRQKALAVWETVVKFRHQDNPPNEHLQDQVNVHDAIKTFNVYGYGMCCCASANITELARAAGLQARGRIISAHSVPEVFWDGGWHLLDASLITYFPKADGQLASVDEIIAGVKEWYGQHPELKGNDQGLRSFMRGEGWKKGPAILAASPFYDRNGWLPAATHGWYATMQEYDGSDNGHTEYGYSEGYQVNVQLRPGERLTRNWSNRGLQVNGLEGGRAGCARTAVGQGDLRYAPKYGDLAPGRVGNGTLAWDVPLADRDFRRAALAEENLGTKGEDGRVPALHLKDASQPGTLVLRVPSSYVYLGGQLSLKATVPSGGHVAVAFSDNNGLDWRPVTDLTASAEQTVDLKPLVYRRYDYRLKFTLAGKGVGLETLRLTHDVQHSQRPLPALAQGENTLRFSVGPAEGTVTVEGSLDLKAKGKQLTYRDFHPELKGVKDPWLVLSGGEGSVTFPVETPGDMTHLRMGCTYRARGAADAWEVQVSFDGGKTFRTVETLAGPHVGNTRYVTFKDVPAGTRSALVRWSGKQKNTLCLFNLRIDADYREPAGGFRPVKVSYRWDEDGVAKEHVHVARQPEETFRIRCAGKPVMKSLAVELAE